MNKIFAISIGLASLCVSASSHAQEKTPVAVDILADYSVATNPFSQNWEIALGIQGLSFYSNQENFRAYEQSPFKSFRTQLGIGLSVSKWFTPEIALRTKLSGFWGRSVSRQDKEYNAVKYFSLHEDFLLNLNNLISGYSETRRWDLSPYLGVGVARNFSYNKTPITMNLGIVGTYRIAEKVKAFADFGFTLCGGEFDEGPNMLTSNIINSRDRWMALELGAILELGQNKWKRVPDMKDVEVVPWYETERELKRTRRKVRDLANEVDYLRNQKPAAEPAPQPVYKSNSPEVSIFFEIGSSELNHRGQLENIKKIVETAKNEHRTLIVAGYADSQTGNAQLNERLSARRADTIVKEILEMGIDAQQIKIVIGGGVDTLNPLPANRRVVVSLGE